ncbi:hypothetical protein Syun_027457 [Stephania yunnanensis]|uniref:Uncharacterized protein n=1 Tax=Stephania yunnanensis TaxID=152371 RepID=A0AAP0EFQ4_9MAGN
MNSNTSDFIPGHQKRRRMSAYILVRPGCTENRERRASWSISVRKSAANGIHDRPRYLKQESVDRLQSGCSTRHHLLELLVRLIAFLSLENDR